MKFNICFYLFLLTLAMTCDANDINKEPLTLVYTPDSTYIPGSLPRKNNWLGLTCEESICRTAPLALKILDDAVADTYSQPGDKLIAVEKIEIQNNDNLYILFTNIDLPQLTNIRSLEPVELPLREEDRKENFIARWSLSNDTESITILAKLHLTERGADYYIQKGKKIQHVFSTVVDEAYAENAIRFAGDLDNDRKIDIIFGISSCTTGSSLYLSSTAKRNKILGLTSSAVPVLDPCGC